MANVPMPELGETITQGTITKWLKAVGDTVAIEDALFEVSTDKVDAEVPSPFAGRITEILVPQGSTVDVGTAVAVIDSDAGASVVPPPPVAPAPVEVPAIVPAVNVSTPVAPAPVVAPVESPAAPVMATSSPVSSASARVATPEVFESKLVTSPIVRKLMNELGPEAQLVVGTGPDGRVTRKDAEKVAYGPGHRKESGSRGAPTTSVPAATPDPVRAAPVVAQDGDTIIPFTKTRRITADRMVVSKATSPHVMTAVEVDYERIETVRKAHQAKWRREEGFTLTYLPFICRALVQTLAEFPVLNSSVATDGVVVHRHIDLNIAVDINFEGLLAPVVRRVEDKRMGAIAREISDLAGRARTGKLRADELSAGTFTISNSGPFGTFMVAPIINQPQVAILSTDGVARKPVVVTDEFGGESIAIHSVGMLVLSWDHRAFDGAYAAAFMRALKKTLETHDWESEL